MASSALAIYLVQEGGLNFYNTIIYEKYLHTGINLNFIFILILFLVISIILPIFIDKIRIFITNPLERFINKRLEKVIVLYKLK